LPQCPNVNPLRFTLSVVSLDNPCWLESEQGFVTLLAAIRGKKKTTVGEINPCDCGSRPWFINAASLILWPSKAAGSGLPRTRWRAFVMQLPCKSEKLFYIFIMSFEGSVRQDAGRATRWGEMNGPAVLVRRPGAGRVRPRASWAPCRPERCRCGGRAISSKAARVKSGIPKKPDR
jgi:hypothetical protein